MSFAKNQEEEVTNVPGVSYTDTNPEHGRGPDGNDGDGVAVGGSSSGRSVRGGQARSGPPHSMDVEMGPLRGGVSGGPREGGSFSSDPVFSKQEDSGTFV